MNFIVDQIATGIISDINSASSTSINLIILNKNFTIFACSHYTTSNRTTYSVFQEFTLRSWVAKNNSSTFRLHVTFFYSCLSFFNINSKFILCSILVLLISVHLTKLSSVVLILIIIILLPIFKISMVIISVLVISLVAILSLMIVLIILP